MSTNKSWPELPYTQWADSCTTLHLWTQIVGKIRMAKSPWINHGWHVTLYVTPRGLTTSPIVDGARQFGIDFDFVQHRLVILLSDGDQRSFKLEPMTVAVFYARIMSALGELGIVARINTMPNEIPEPIRFDKDTVHSSYDAAYVNRFWRALVQTDRVFKQFRACFTGKCSPVHFFWGSFDLAVTRFSGRAAPEHPGGIPYLPDAVTREAYCQEVSSAGFWPGGGPIDYAAFYSYAYPPPDGFAVSNVQPKEAFFHADLGEFLLPYDAVRSAADPNATLWAFLQSTYAAAADGASWDRQNLEREPVAPRESSDA
jgi:hypothetical protein